MRRMAAYFAASLEKPTSPFEVAKTIQDIVDGKSSKLRNPTGSDGAKLIQWRKNKTDEEWISLGAGICKVSMVRRTRIDIFIQPEVRVIALDS